MRTSASLTAGGRNGLGAPRGRPSPLRSDAHSQAKVASPLSDFGIGRRGKKRTLPKRQVPDATRQFQGISVIGPASGCPSERGRALLERKRRDERFRAAPPLSEAEQREEIERFIEVRGITKCPPGYAAPIGVTRW